MMASTPRKPLVYLDKGALSALSLTCPNPSFEICYSEALLIDLKSDKTERKYSELSSLNVANALYLIQTEDGLSAKVVNAHDEFASISTLELDAMFEIYGFMNGGGEANLYEVAERQFTTISDAASDILGCNVDIFKPLFESANLSALKILTADAWHRDVQKATGAWNKNDHAEVSDVFEADPEISAALAAYLPAAPSNFQSIQLSAMLLGVLHLGRDKGINSPRSEKSKKAAQNGYIDCMHIAYGMYCDVFVTTDQATLRRYRLLVQHWGLDKHSFLLEKGAPQGA